MDSNIFKGNWHILKGKIKEQWGDLTDDDLDKIDGKKDQLIGRLEKKYGYTVDEAKKKIKEFESNHTSHTL